MDKIQFDIRGNVAGQDIIKLRYDEFKDHFVFAFERNSKRHLLLERYENYMEDLGKLLRHGYFQWIDGSFISKKPDPRDMDLVTFIDARNFDRNERIFANDYMTNRARRRYQLDAYVNVDYPPLHRKSVYTRSDLLYWQHQFETTKENRAQKKFQKSFVQLNFKGNGK